jgi:hypothetical protein
VKKQFELAVVEVFKMENDLSTGTVELWNRGELIAALCVADCLCFSRLEFDITLKTQVDKANHIQ